MKLEQEDWEGKKSDISISKYVELVLSYPSCDADGALEKVNTKHGGFDIVIDDGGHTWYQQQTTFEFLFPRINPDGMYVIEDLSTSYLKGSIYDTGNPTMVEFLKRIMDDLNLNGKSTCGVKELKGKSLTLYEQWLESIFFFKGLCIIKKRKVSL